MCVNKEYLVPSDFHNMDFVESTLWGGKYSFKIQESLGIWFAEYATC